MNLSARSYWLAGLVTALGILEQWYGARNAGLWRSAAAMIIFALLVEGWAVRKLLLRLQREGATRRILGRPFNAAWRLTNSSSRVVQVEIQAPLPVALTGPMQVLRLYVPAHGEQAQPFRAIPQKLGRHDWPDVYARVSGIFGLAWWPRRLASGGPVVISPDYLHSAERGVGTRQLGELQRRRSGSGNELLLLRDYQPGDSLRLIDWKASARSGKHMVRVFAEELHVELLIVIDAGRTSALRAGALTRLGHVANSAARLAEQAILNGDRVGVVVFADTVIESLPPLRGSAGLLRVRAVLERLESRARESNPLAATLHARRLARQRCLVVVYSDIGEADAAGQLAKATALLTPKHLPLIAALHEPEISALAAQPARDWLDPYISYAACETLHNATLAAHRLRRLGAEVVQAAPTQLDAAVLGYYDRLRRRKRIG